MKKWVVTASCIWSGYAYKKHVLHILGLEEVGAVVLTGKLNSKSLRIHSSMETSCEEYFLLSHHNWRILRVPFKHLLLFKKLALDHFVEAQSAAVYLCCSLAVKEPKIADRILMKYLSFPTQLLIISFFSFFDFKIKYIGCHLHMVILQRTCFLAMLYLPQHRTVQEKTCNNSKHRNLPNDYNF